MAKALDKNEQFLDCLTFMPFQPVLFYLLAVRQLEPHSHHIVSRWRKVEYDYDNGGQLISMIGNKASTQSYVNNIKYDEFGSRTYFEYGNGVSSSYIYNTATRRLQNLITTTTNGNLHDITYTYDPVGNITRIRNTAGGADGLGGKFSYNYSYDDLYRPDSSDGR